MPPDASWPNDSWLILLVPGVVLAGLALARGAGVGRGVARLLAPALGVGAWLLAVHATGRSLGSFRGGLWIGTLGVGSIGYASLAWGRLRRRAGGDGTTLPTTMLATAVLATALLAPMALTWALHDEELITGHLSIASEILRGVYPPRHLTFPQYELRYHYGFNLLTASLSTLTGLEPRHWIDPLTLAAWGYCWCLLWMIGERVAGTGGGLAASALTLLGGGLPWIVPGEAASGAHRLLGSVWIERAPLNPPMISYFFQHPWTLGLPLALAAILIHVEPVPEGRSRYAGRLGALAVLVAALGQSQFVLFAALAASLVVAEPMAGGLGRMRPPRVAATVAALGLAVLASSRLGGFFLPPPEGGDLGLEFTTGVAGGFVGSLLWCVGSFGLLLPLGIAGLLVARRGRLLLGLLVSGGLLVVNLLHYRYSADIAKFATVSALALGIGSSAALLRVARRRPRWLGWPIASALVAGTLAEALVFLAVFTFRPDLPPPDVFQKEVARLPESHRPAVAWLRTHVAADEAVYVREGLALAYAERGGLPSAWYDAGTLTFGFPTWRLKARARLLSGLPDDPDALLGQRIRWVVLDAEDTDLAEIVAGWIRAGRAVEAARFDTVRVIRLKRPGGVE